MTNSDNTTTTELTAGAKTHQLYKHYDSEGVLLYVGISLSATNRLYQHKSESHWYHNIARVDIENFPSRVELMAAEIKQIRELGPLHNIREAAASSLTDELVHAVQFEGRPRKLRDGNGLYVHVLPSGKYFRYDYRFREKRKTVSFGVYPKVSIADARHKLYKAKDLISEGKDPSEEKQASKINSKRITPKDDLERSKALWLINSYN